MRAENSYKLFYNQIEKSTQDRGRPFSIVYENFN